MLIQTVIQRKLHFKLDHGVPQQIANICFSLRKMMILDLNALNAQRNIV